MARYKPNPRSLTYELLRTFYWQIPITTDTRHLLSANQAQAFCRETISKPVSAQTLPHLRVESLKLHQQQPSFNRQGSGLGVIAGQAPAADVAANGCGAVLGIEAPAKP
jgi:hypothetical protein